MANEAMTSQDLGRRGTDLETSFENKFLTPQKLPGKFSPGKEPRPSGGAAARGISGAGDPALKFFFENLNKPDIVTSGDVGNQQEKLQQYMMDKGKLGDPKFDAFNDALTKWKDDLRKTETSRSATGIIIPEMVVAEFESLPNINEKQEWLEERLNQLMSSATPTQTLAQTYEQFAQELRAIKNHFLQTRGNAYAAKFGLSNVMRAEYENMYATYESIDSILNWGPQIIGAGTWDRAFGLIASIAPDPASLDRHINTCMHIKIRHNGKDIYPVAQGFRLLDANAKQYKEKRSAAGGDVTNDWMTRKVGWLLQGDYKGAEGKADLKENPDLMVYAYLAEQIWWTTWRAAEHGIGPKYALDMFDFGKWLDTQSGVPLEIGAEIKALEKDLFKDNKKYWQIVAGDVSKATLKTMTANDVIANAENIDTPAAMGGKPRMLSCAKAWKGTESLKKATEGGSFLEHANIGSLYESVAKAGLFSELENPDQRTEAVVLLFNWCLSRGKRTEGRRFKWDKSERKHWIYLLERLGLAEPILQEKIMKA